jgi:membrane protease YdiL (CAAX protease family)
MGRLQVNTASGSRWADASAVVFALALPTLLAWLYFIRLAQSPGALQQTVYTLGKTVQFAFPILWVLAVQRRRLRWKRPAAPGLYEGLGFGVLVFVGALLLYHGWLKPAGYFDHAREAIAEKLQGFGLTGPTKYVAFAVFLALAHSLLEEYYWRWFVFGQLRRLIPLWAAITVSSLGFMSHHVIVLGSYFGWSSPATVLFSLAVAGGGAVWAWIYHRSDSLYGPWLSHLIVDAAIMVVGYDLARDLFAA